MNKYLRRIGLGIGALVLPGVIGCNNAKHVDDNLGFIEGEVITESESITSIERSHTQSISKETIRICKPTYVLTIKTTDGQMYNLAVLDNCYKPIAALAQAIDIGDTVRFARRDRSAYLIRNAHRHTPNTYNSSASIDPEDHIGIITSDLVTLVRKAEKKKE